VSESNKLKLYSINAAARELGLGKDSVHRLIKSGKIGFLDFGKRKKIPYNEIIRYESEYIIRNNIENNLIPIKQNSTEPKKARVSQYGHNFLEKLMEK